MREDCNPHELLSKLFLSYVNLYSIPFFVKHIDGLLNETTTVRFVPDPGLQAYTRISQGKADIIEGKVGIVQGKAEIILSIGFADVLFRVFCRIARNPRALAGFLHIPAVYEESAKRTRAVGVLKLNYRLKSGPIPKHVLQKLCDAALPDTRFNEFLGAGREAFITDLSNLSYKQYLLALACTMCALEYICLHELAHLSEGHTQYLQSDARKRGLFVEKVDHSHRAGPALHHYFENIADITAMQTGLRLLFSRKSFLHLPDLQMARLLSLGRRDAFRFYFLTIRVLYLLISTLTTFTRGEPELGSVMNDMANIYPPVLSRRKNAEGLGLVRAYRSLTLRQLRWPLYHFDRWRITRRLGGVEYVAWEESGFRSLIRGVDADYLKKTFDMGQNNRTTVSMEDIHKQLQMSLIDAKFAWLLGDKYNELRDQARKLGVTITPVR